MCERNTKKCVYIQSLYACVEKCKINQIYWHSDKNSFLFLFYSKLNETQPLEKFSFLQYFFVQTQSIEISYCIAGDEALLLCVFNYKGYATGESIKKHEIFGFFALKAFMYIATKFKCPSSTQQHIVYATKGK